MARSKKNGNLDAALERQYFRPDPLFPISLLSSLCYFSIIQAISPFVKPSH